MMADKDIQKHIYISGRVQGVGFRAFCRSTARTLGIKGWVRNLRDGRVELVIQGPPAKVEKMVENVKEGPSFAKVDDIEIKNEECEDFSTFEIRL